VEIQLRGNHAGYALYHPFDEKRRPTSPITAKIALPFVIGVAVTTEDVTVSDFLQSNLDNPTVLGMADKVTFNLDDSMGNYDSEVRVIMADGTAHSATVNTLRGSILDPMSIDDLVAKFKSCARHSKKPLTEQTLNQLVDNILNLEKVADIKEFVQLLDS
jgi:2-methylcitrate dehydratase PrpD